MDLIGAINATAAKNSEQQHDTLQVAVFPDARTAPQLFLIALRCRIMLYALGKIVVDLQDHTWLVKMYMV